MENTTVEIKRDPCDVGAVTMVVGVVNKLLSVDIVNQAVRNPRGADNVVVIASRLGLQRTASRVCARPDHKLGALV